MFICTNIIITMMMAKEEIEYECLICGHRIKSDSLKRIMCYECEKTKVT